MSETAPERPTSSGPASSSAPPGPHRENVFTRKIGPLPMWVWLVIVAGLVLLYVVWSSSKKKQSSSSSSSGQQQTGGFGRALLPEVILERIPGPPHTRHRHHRGGHHHRHHSGHHRGGVDPGGPMDPGSEEATALAADRQKAARDPGPGAHSIPGHNRRHMRGQPIPGELVEFKTAEQGQTPSLADVANNYDTDPEAIVMEAEGRGYPSSTAWKRYVAAHDWGSPLPPATRLSILAHPQ
jgi:hypothetical protein